MRKKRSGILLLLVLTSVIGLFVCVSAVALEPAASKNVSKHAYIGHSSTVKSHLYEENGLLTRVENVDGHVIVETYTMGFQIQSQKEIPFELPLWGGFYAGEHENYLIFGQENREENDNKEVVRVVKYDKGWNRLGEAKLYGLNTTIPFRSGSLRCAEDADTLYINTSHQMYKSDDGLNHQSSLSLSIRKATMELVDEYEAGNSHYVSHSFNQYILVDGEGRVVTFDHGDAYPRSAVLVRGSDSAEIRKFPGEIGDNKTDGSLGGLAETSTGYVTAYECNDAGRRTVFLGYTPKDQLSTEGTKSTPLYRFENAAFLERFGPTPVLVPTDRDSGYVMWYGAEEFIGYHTGQYVVPLFYTTYRGDGSIGEIKSISAKMSDCQPIYVNGKIIWYVTEDNVPVFYTLEDGRVTAVAAGKDGQFDERFYDVKAGDWCYESVKWACQRQIANGIDAINFGTDRPCTVSQILTFLWRANNSPASTAPCPVSDIEPSSVFYPALCWAGEKGLITSGEGNLPCTRAQAMTYLWKLAGSPTAGTAKFSDVPAGADYAQAVAWAVAEGVTQGTSATKFSPDATCTRGQIVTFLYRAMA